MKKYVKKILFGLFIALILFIALMIVINYNEEGEKVLPFKLSKIVIVSAINGNSKTGSDTIWDIDLNQINDFYISVAPENNTNKETIKSITLKNFRINPEDVAGNKKILTPTGELGATLYSNSEENYIDTEIVVDGGTIDDLKSKQIGNMGGTIAFRYELENIGNFKGNDETEIKYDASILQKVGLDVQKLNTEISFDLLIKTSKNISYKGNIKLQTPVGNLSENASGEKVIEDFNNVVFKRVKE